MPQNHANDRIVIVNDRDIPIGLKTYAELRYEDIYRVSALWLTDIKSGDILLQQRTWTKHNDPGKWQCAVSGTIDEGETYEQNIIKETAEEIGLSGLVIHEGPKEYNDDGAHRFFCQWFRATTNMQTAKIVIQESELEDYQWIAREALITDVTNNPGKYASSMLHGMELLGVVSKAIPSEESHHETS
jgi:isopentenyldiphosphate isomerase